MFAVFETFTRSSFLKWAFFLNLTIKECAKIRVWRVIAGLVGLMPLCHRGYFLGPKFFLVGISWILFFLVGTSLVQNFSRGYFVGPKVFLVGIMWVQFFFSALISVDSKIFSCWLHEKEWQKREMHKYAQTAYSIPNLFQQFSVLFILEKYFIN